MSSIRQKFWLLLAMLCLAWGLPVVQGAVVFPPSPPATEQRPVIPHQFDIIGYIQDATVDSTHCPQLAPDLWGGTLVVNNLMSFKGLPAPSGGIHVLVTCNT